MVLLNNWKSRCCYQFSIDRLKDDEPHNMNNVLISCYYCNCRHHPSFDQDNKICKSGCHKENKSELPRKYLDLKFISEKINKYKLTDEEIRVFKNKTIDQ